VCRDDVDGVLRETTAVVLEDVLNAFESCIESLNGLVTLPTVPRD